MAARMRPAGAAEVAAAWAELDAGTAEGAPSTAAVRLLTRHYLAVLVARHPGRSVEVRVPPYAVVQCVSGARHIRGTPPAVVETDSLTWIGLARGTTTWDEAVGAGLVSASGERSDLSALLPLTT